jgi:hypothetical protein
MNMDERIACPHCGHEIVDRMAGCRHLRWTPDRGGPIDFAMYVVFNSPYTSGRGLRAIDIPTKWWEEQYEWLLDRVSTRLSVVDGYVFGEMVDIDLFCMDIWHRFAPEPARVGIDRSDGNGKSVLSPYLKP